MRLVALVENTACADIAQAHGLSLYIETEKHRILFDAGPDGALLLSNAEKLGIDLKRVDIAVLSHGHYDHAGGLRAFMELNSSAKAGGSPLLTAAAGYLRKNLLKTPCDVTELAAALGYSRAHFTRKFTAECGMPPGKFLLDWRLRMAARILSTEHSQIKSVAWQTGFSDVSHFCRVFKQKYGISPKSFCAVTDDKNS